MFAVLKILNKRVHADGWFLSCYFIWQRLHAKIKSLILGKLLGAPKINMGAGCHFFGTKFIHFGTDIYVDRNLWLEAVCEYEKQKFNPEIRLGDRIQMSDGVHISAIHKIIIGNDVLFGSHIYVSDHNHGAYTGNMQTPPSAPPAKRRLYSAGEVVIEDNVWIGDNVNIVGPVRIGFGSVIAANSVVRKDVPPRTIVAGVPARVIKSYNDSTEKWENDFEHSKKC